jgi:hypothetical protein
MSLVVQVVRALNCVLKRSGSKPADGNSTQQSGSHGQVSYPPPPAQTDGRKMCMLAMTPGSLLRPDIYYLLQFFGNLDCSGDPSFSSLAVKVPTSAWCLLQPMLVWSDLACHAHAAG